MEKITMSERLLRRKPALCYRYDQEPNETTEEKEKKNFKMKLTMKLVLVCCHISMFFVRYLHINEMACAPNSKFNFKSTSMID